MARAHAPTRIMEPLPHHGSATGAAPGLLQGLYMYVSFADMATESRFIVLVSGSLLVGLTVELHRLTELWPFSPVHVAQLILHP